MGSWHSGLSLLSGPETQVRSSLPEGHLWARPPESRARSLGLRFRPCGQASTSLRSIPSLPWRFIPGGLQGVHEGSRLLSPRLSCPSPKGKRSPFCPHPTLAPQFNGSPRSTCHWPWQVLCRLRPISEAEGEDVWPLPTSAS